MKTKKSIIWLIFWVVRCFLQAAVSILISKYFYYQISSLSLKSHRYKLSPHHHHMNYRMEIESVLVRKKVFDLLASYADITYVDGQVPLPPGAAVTPATPVTN